MKDKLINVLKKCETKQLAHVFEEYMKSKNIRKLDGRRKDNSISYLIDAKSTNWNRVQCFYNNGSTHYSEEDLLIVLRKEAGYYLIVERKGVRAFEYDYKLINYKEELLNEIYYDHKELFDNIFKIIEV